MNHSDNDLQIYPQIGINLAKLKNNADTLVLSCRNRGIAVTGVIKGFGGFPPAADVLKQAGCDYIASSRFEHIIRCKKENVEGPFMALRIPMMSELPHLINHAEVSLHSELEVLKTLDSICRKQGKKHKVMLMADLGDLREGYYEENELITTAQYLEKKLTFLHLLGIGTNLGCYGSVMASVENMSALVNLAEKIEKRIGRELELISGGASTSYPLVENGLMPERINHLRIGGAFLVPKNLRDNYGCRLDGVFEDVVELRAEVVEVKDKPSFPVGVLAKDAFGQTVKYEDKGIMRRAIAAVGKIDFGYLDCIKSKEHGINIIGASSDHLILDVSSSRCPIKPGDILRFSITYAAMAFLTSSENVKIISE